MPVVYVYIFEDGTVKQSQLPPLDGDLACVGDGLLQVLRSDGTKVEEVDQDDNWTELPSAEYNQVCGQEFHE